MAGAQFTRTTFDHAEYILIHQLNYFVTNTIVFSNLISNSGIPGT